MSKDTTLMDKIVALCKRRGFIFQNSEIYGGQNGFWDYGPLGVELKRNVREAWWQDMVARHDPLAVPAGAPAPYQMVGVETSIIMHPQVWKVSGHYDLFHDMMIDCRDCKGRFRADHLASIPCPNKPSKMVGAARGLSAHRASRVQSDVQDDHRGAAGPRTMPPSSGRRRPRGSSPTSRTCSIPRG